VNHWDRPTHTSIQCSVCIDTQDDESRGTRGAQAASVMRQGSSSYGSCFRSVRMRGTSWPEDELEACARLIAVTFHHSARRQCTVTITSFICKNEAISKRHHSLCQQWLFRVDCCSKSLYPEKRDMKWMQTLVLCVRVHAPPQRDVAAVHIHYSPHNYRASTTNSTQTSKPFPSLQLCNFSRIIKNITNAEVHYIVRKKTPLPLSWVRLIKYKTIRSIWSPF
jgi:hypothetical protein